MAQSRPAAADDDIVKVYLSEIGSYSLLGKNDEVRLAKAIEAGCEAATSLEQATRRISRSKLNEWRRLVLEGDEARQTFVRANLRLVVSIARRYQAPGLSLLDLVQDGNMGLIHAVEKFEWRKGFKFSTYATWWIRQAINRGIANAGRTIRLPVNATDKLTRIRHAQSFLAVRLGRAPTLDELAAESMLSRSELVEAMEWRFEPLSLSAPLAEDSDSSLGDIVLADTSAVSPFDHALASVLSDEVVRLLQPLDDRETAVLRLRFGLDHGEPQTLEEIGEQFHLTRERIRQIEAKAMSKLRHPSVANNAHELLDG
jgi:RNA polymerase primary sigma factor